MELTFAVVETVITETDVNSLIVAAVITAVVWPKKRKMTKETLSPNFVAIVDPVLVERVAMKTSTNAYTNLAAMELVSTCREPIDAIVRPDSKAHIVNMKLTNAHFHPAKTEPIVRI